MTVTALTYEPAEYVANGVSNEFAFSFHVLEPEHLLVYLNDILQTSGYSAEGIDEPGGGVVTITPTPAAGVNVKLDRSTEVTQEQIYTYPSTNHERSLDKLTLIAQEYTARIAAASTAADAAADVAVAAEGEAAAAVVTANAAAANAATAVIDAEGAAVSAAAAAISAALAAGTFVNNVDGTLWLSTIDLDLIYNFANFASVGPTGAGAVNLWPALDLVTPGSQWVDICVINYALSSSGTPEAEAYSQVHARKTGSTTPTSDRTMLSIVGGIVSPGGKLIARDVLVRRVPIDTERRFDIRFLSANVQFPSCHIGLVGFGKNP
jgi:hypothetical protein